MIHLLSALSIVLFSVAFGQSNITVFNNGGQQFYVILNGVKQNFQPMTNVVVSGLKNGTRFNTTQMTVPSKGWRGWYTFEADVVATAATQLLGFTAYGPGVPPVFLVADVSLYDTTNPPPVDPPETVPEPSTLAIAGTGLVIAGIASLRRRARGKVEAV